MRAGCEARAARRLARATQSFGLGLVLLAAGASAPSAFAADADNGARLYRQHCAGCHGSNGKPVLPAAPDLSRPMALMRGDLALLAFVKSGRGAMPAFAGVLKDREVLDVLAHLRTLR